MSRARLTLILGPLFSLALTATLLHYRERVEALAGYGYPAVVLLGFLTHATVVFPGPTYGVAIALGAILNPVGVGACLGLGAAAGESIAYFVGASGRGWVDAHPEHARLRARFDAWDFGFIFALAALPNPFFDVGGMIAGAARMRFWKFFLATLLGKSLRFALVAALSGAVLE